MSEHLSLEHREMLVASLRMACDYFCEWSTDSDLFTLHGLLCTHAAQLAHRLAMQGDGMLGPDHGPQLGEAMNHRLQAAMQRMLG